MRISIEAVCNRGLIRENNEDAVSVGGVFLRDDSLALTVTTSDDGWFCLLVSDGMGGHERGEEASEYTLKSIADALTEGRIHRDSFEDDIRETVRAASAKSAPLLA